MEVRDFARQLLFGESLSDKLAAPPAGTLRDDDPGPPMEAPDAPGRPPQLAFRSDRPPVRFPHASRLGDPSAAVTALHSFANHELLALELMALALLRFPSADPRFRRELIATMRDEQRHLAMYLERIEELGGRFGEHATSPFFWDCLAHTDTVDAFVAGMSLTLEQANLDFAVEYAAAFRAVGDERTAALLERVHREEIAHVARGVQHFSRAHPDTPLWEAFVQSLPDPLTPRRARGNTVDLPSRSRAGLPESFVQHVRVYAHSKGRRPILYVWNPACEDEIAKGPHHARAAVVADLEHDLETLPLLLASEDDVVQVSEAPALSWLATLADAGLPLPRFATPEEAATLEVERVAPWGVSPAFPQWSETLRPVFDKRWSADWLGRLHDDLQKRSGGRLLPGDALPTLVHDADDAWRRAKALRSRGFPHVVFKQGLGASGRGQLRLLHEPEPTTSQWGWLRRHGPSGLRVEPWLEREADLSFHFDLDDAGLHPRGVVSFTTDRGGRFLAARVGSPTAGLPGPVRRFLAGDGKDTRWLDRVLAGLAALAEPLWDAGHRGPVGIDAMVALDPRDGRRALQPMLELNPRWTFGRLALRLRGRGARNGWLRLVSPDDAPGLVAAGAVALNDPQRARRVVAVWDRG
ncbi:MAG: DUF455 family protein [Deltaproteobacteria bacterium]|nr:DUF455 family protein [Deltaproteobacteria bacterium]